MENGQPAPPAPASTEGPEALVEAIAEVLDPELGAPLVSLGMVPRVGLDGSTATVEVGLTTAACPLRGRISRELTAALEEVEGVEAVDVRTVELAPEAKAAVMARARFLARREDRPASLPAHAQVVAVGSGKGGVGKSSVTVNLAVALAMRGHRVGIIDADISGFSVPRLLGASGPVEARDGRMLPVEVDVAGVTLRVLSMGFLAEEDRAVMWRGLLLARALQQFIEDADWSGIDYLVVDLPPGTSDVQMALGRLLPSSSLLLVTTPASAAAQVAVRSADMASKGYLALAGVVENMAPFTDDRGTTYAFFGEGGGAELAQRLGVPLLGSIPLNPEVAAGGDAGLPVAAAEGGVAKAFAELAEGVEARVPLPEMAGCSARILEAMEAAASS